MKIRKHRSGCVSNAAIDIIGDCILDIYDADPSTLPYNLFRRLNINK